MTFTKMIAWCFWCILEPEALEADMGNESKVDGVPFSLQRDNQTDYDEDLFLPQNQ